MLIIWDWCVELFKVVFILKFLVYQKRGKNSGRSKISHICSNEISNNCQFCVVFTKGIVNICKHCLQVRPAGKFLKYNFQMNSSVSVRSRAKLLCTYVISVASSLVLKSLRVQFSAIYNITGYTEEQCFFCDDTRWYGVPENPKADANF